MEMTEIWHKEQFGNERAALRLHLRRRIARTSERTTSTGRTTSSRADRVEVDQTRMHVHTSTQRTRRNNESRSVALEVEHRQVAIRFDDNAARRRSYQDNVIALRER